MFEFKVWLIEQEQEAVNAFKKENPKKPGQYFIVLYGNTYPIFKDNPSLKKMGFRYFQGTWSIPERIFLFNDEEVKKSLEDRAEMLGIRLDLSGLEKNIVGNKENKPEETSPHPEIEKRMDDIKDNLDNLLKDKDAKMKNLVDSIEMAIERIASLTDEASKKKLISDFLNFCSKFYNYSYANQMLIWAQTKGKAQHVASATAWTKLGRTVTDWSKPISIFAPITLTKKPNKTEEDEDENIKKVPEKVTKFRIVKVYDISSTTPVNDNAFKPLSRKDWSVDSNEDIEELNFLINALTKWVKENGINLNFEELSDELGGYSAGKIIAVNNKFKGINLFSTLVHETAHELLHWLESESRSKLGSDSSRAEKEIDAETTAYIVCSHFGFETKDAPNYLALWRATGDKVRERKKHIHKASKMIIEGIKDKVQDVEIEFED